MTLVRIPTPLRHLTGGAATVEASGKDLGFLLANLEHQYPGFDIVLFEPDRGGVKRHVNIYVNDDDFRYSGGLFTAVSDTDTVAIIPAIAGGI